MTDAARRKRSPYLIAGVAALALIGALPASSAAQSSDDGGMTGQGARDIAETVFGAYLAAGHAEEAHDYGRAADLLDRILAHQSDDPLIQRRAMLANLHAGRLERAIDLARPQVAVYPGEVDIAGLTLAADAILSGDWQRATKALEPPRRVALARFATPVLAAWAHQGAGDTSSAMEALSVLREASDLPVLHDYHAGLIFLAADRPEEAEAILSPYGDNLEGTAIGMVRALARARLVLGDRDGADALLRGYNAVNPGLQEVERDIALLESDGALPPVVESPAAGSADAMVNLARQIRGRAPLIALRYARLGVLLDPANDLGRMLVAAILETHDRHAEAITELKYVSDESVFGWDARIEIADNLILLERDAEAIDHLEAMTEERADDLDALERLGYLMRLRERYDEGTDYYDRALARVDTVTGNHWTLFYHRGITLERTQRWPEAESDFQRALELKPDDPYVLNYLGYSWVDQGLNIQEALDMIRKAVEQRPNDGYIVDSLGWAYYRLEDFEEAVVHLERAVQLRPQDPVINDHLGDAYWRVGRELEARFQWTRALGLEPADEDRESIEMKLLNGLKTAEN